MKKFSLLILSLAITGLVMAQKKPAEKSVRGLSYYVQGEGGMSGLTVVFNPDNGYYYCIQAGNAEFPLEVFNSTGGIVYTTNAKKDCRGFWYNPILKCFEGTMYKGGTFKTYIDENGYPTNAVTQGNSMDYEAPEDQCQTVCNVTKGEMYSLSKFVIHVYNKETYKLKKKIKLKKCPVSWGYVNPYGFFYTGYKNYEFGLYDVVNYQVLYFNAGGKYTGATQLPSDVPPIESFRVGFANDRIFLYDHDNRAWYGYKIF